MYVTSRGEVKCLDAQGYYDGEVTYRIDQSVRPIMVDLEVVTGPRYTLEAFEIRYVGESTDTSDLPSDLAPLGIDLGMPARAPAIVSFSSRSGSAPQSATRRSCAVLVRCAALPDPTSCRRGRSWRSCSRRRHSSRVRSIQSRRP